MREIAELGPHFGIQVRDSSFVVDDSWRPLEVLLDGSGALGERYRQVQDALAKMAGRPVEFRVAASVGHLALVARLLCPAFGAALLDRHLDLRRAWWQPALGGAMPLSVPVGAIGPGRSLRPGRALRPGRSLGLGRPVRCLVRLTGALSVSPKVLWGNVVSVINGAVTTVSRSRPDLSDRATKLGALLLADPNLAAAFTSRPGEDLRRRSCCLIYRIAPAAGGTYCGDCVLLGPRTSRK